MKNHIGFIIFATSIIFNVVESLYFGFGTTRGFNIHADSIPELICDDICLVGMILGAYIMGLKIANTYLGKQEYIIVSGRDGGVVKIVKESNK